MTKITKEEVLAIAEMTKIAIAPTELDAVVAQLQDVLAYAARVQEISKEVSVPSSKNVNHNRPDQAVEFDAQEILKRAVQEQDGYFVVPKILDN